MSYQVYIQGPKSANMLNIPEQPGPPENLWQGWNVQNYAHTYTHTHCEVSDTTIY